jgi:hypothetical protein
MFRETEDSADVRARKLPDAGGLIRLDVDCLDHRRPASNLTRHKGGEAVVRAPSFLEFLRELWSAVDSKGRHWGAIESRAIPERAL